MQVKIKERNFRSLLGESYVGAVEIFARSSG